MTAVIVTAIALGMSARQTPVYTATARLLIKQVPDVNHFPEAEDEASTVRSDPVAAGVIEDLGLGLSEETLLANLSVVTESPTSNVLVLSYNSTDPVEARDVANSFMDQYIEYRTQQLQGGTASQRRALQNQRDQIERELSQVNIDLERASQRGDTVEVSDLELDKIRLEGQLQAVLEEIRSLRVFVEIQVAEKQDIASVPTSPSAPNHLRNGLLGALAGVMLGVGLAFLRERLDDRFRGRPDVERALGSPVLATVPRFSTSRNEPAAQLPSITDPKGAASEAYRNLRTGVQFISAQRELRTILVTSPSAHEGKTSTTANLGITLSQTGKRVVLVSCDLRRPQLEKTFGAESDVGLSSWLLGEIEDPATIVLEHPQLPNLSLVPAGPVPSNPAEVLTSPRLGDLVDHLEAMFDVILFDSPPALPVADAVILASYVDAVILVLDAGKTSRSAAVHAKEQLERVGAQIIGCVLNAFDPATTPYYYEPYYYSRYYEPYAEDSSKGEGQAQILDLHESRRK